MERNVEQYEWLRRPDETDKAYQSFLAYLNLDPPRTLDKAKDETGKSIQTMRYLSAKYQWIKRAELYDKYIQLAVADATVDNLISVREQIVAKALEDGGRLRTIWNNLLTELEHDIVNVTDDTDIRKLALAINTLTTTRETIDNMIRRAARMPGSYRNELISEEPFEGEYMIQMDGPPILLDRGDDDET